MKKINVKINKPDYLGLSILKISKTLIYEFCFGYIKPKYRENARLCYTDTDSFIINIKTEDVYEHIVNDVEKDLIHQIMKLIDHSLQEKTKSYWINERSIGGTIITKCVAVRPETCSYLMGDGQNDKKAKGTRKSVIKRILKFNNNKN